MKKSVIGLILAAILLLVISCGQAPLTDTVAYTTPMQSVPSDFATETKGGSEGMNSTTSLVTTDIAVNETTVQDSLTHIEQIFSFTEEFDAKHNAVKITVSSNKKAFVKYLRDETDYLIVLDGEYIENYKYFSDRLDDGRLGVGNDFMESPIIIYIPVCRYAELQGKILHVQGENYRDSNGKLNTVNTAYTLCFDYQMYYSADPIQMKNEFLHQTLTAYFGGEYSHRDLLDIEVLYVDYENFDMDSRRYLPPSISIGYTVGGEGILTTYCYTDFFEKSVEKPSLMPSDLIEDLDYFPALRYIRLRDIEGDEKFDELEKAHLPYRVTEDSWSES